MMDTPHATGLQKFQPNRAQRKRHRDKRRIRRLAKTLNIPTHSGTDNIRTPVEEQELEQAISQFKNSKPIAQRKREYESSKRDFPLKLARIDRAYEKRKRDIALQSAKTNRYLEHKRILNRAARDVRIARNRAARAKSASEKQKQKFTYSALKKRKTPEAKNKYYENEFNLANKLYQRRVNNNLLSSTKTDMISTSSVDSNDKTIGTKKFYPKNNTRSLMDKYIAKNNLYGIKKDMSGAETEMQTFSPNSTYPVVGDAEFSSEITRSGAGTAPRWRKKFTGRSSSIIDRKRTQYLFNEQRTPGNNVWWWIIGIVGVLTMIAAIIGTVVLIVKLNGGGGGGGNGDSEKVTNIGITAMKDPDLGRMAYAFTWKAPKKKGTWYYEYSIYDNTGNPVGAIAQCTSNTFAMIKPYEKVNVGTPYTLKIYSSKKSDCSDRIDGSFVTATLIYPDITQKIAFTWDIKQDGTAPCSTWLHIVPSSFFDMLGDYVATVVDKATGQAIKLGQITYWKVQMFPNAANLQYSIPFNLNKQTDLLIQLSGTNKAGSTVENNLQCSFPSTLPAPGTNICNGSADYFM